MRMKTVRSFNRVANMPAVQRVLSSAGQGGSAGVWALFRLVFKRMAAMRQAMAERNTLAGMDARMFADIGVSQSEAVIEMNRKPWDTAPAGARRSP
jgi:uncharacterized protein YjiS (DUF1127 family)